MDALEAILTRRSISALKPDEPPRDMIEVLLDAAVQAPNHHETHPWRFFVLTGGAREELGEVLSWALRERMAGEDEQKLDGLCAAEYKKPLRAPVLIVVGCKRAENERIVAVEDIEACASAIQNMLLAAHHLGLGAQWRTGDGCYDDVVKAHFGLETEDAIVGIVYVGFPSSEPFKLKDRPRSFNDSTRWLS